MVEQVKIESRARTMNESATVFLVDDDPMVCEALALLLQSEKFKVEAYRSADDFLASYHPVNHGCVILDVSMPEMDGLSLQSALTDRAVRLPVIFLTGKADVPEAVRAMKAGAVDFLKKPISGEELLRCVNLALVEDAKRLLADERRTSLMERVRRLTPREKEVMALLSSGMSNKEIGLKLNISHRTVEVHRSRIMEKMKAESFPRLIDMARACDIV
jgi:RNA polymerase sigma factor (sigma-70 family)